MIENKIMRKLIVPYYLGSAVMLGVMGAGATAIIHHSSKYQSEEETNNNIAGMVSCIALIMLFFYLSKIQMDRDAHEYIQVLTKKYLTGVANEESLRFILRDPYALETVATFVANVLSPDEQKRIVEILKKQMIFSRQHPKKSERADHILSVQRQITEIIDNHAKENPGFLDAVNKIVYDYNKIAVSGIQTHKEKTR